MSKEYYGVWVLSGCKFNLWSMFFSAFCIWRKGQIGVIPVFKSRKEALDYVEGDEKKIFKLKESNE